MKCRFIHAADIHLGYEQYNLAKRADDFARAYLAMVDHAIRAHADFVILAGDLFHRASADAWMLKQASHGLQMLRDARITVVAVEGNHDVQHARKNLSWLEFLSDQELLILLDVQIAANGHKSLPAFDAQERRGGHVDLAGARIYGLKYFGAATARILDEVSGLIEPGPENYTVLILHSGLEGQVPHMHGGLTPGQISPLHPPVDYLALGHVHKRLMENWVFNPGSLETNSFDEIDWPHGFFDVQVDTTTAEKQTVTAVPTPNLRPFRRISILAHESATLDQYIDAVESRIVEESDIPDQAIVELHLGGVATFRRQDVPVDSFTGALEMRFHPLAVRVRNNLVPPGLVTVRSQERTSRAEVESRAVEQLVYQQAEFRDRAPQWTRLILDVKNMAAEKDTPASIADHVRSAIGEFLRRGDADENDATTPGGADRVDGALDEGDR